MVLLKPILKLEQQNCSAGLVSGVIGRHTLAFLLPRGSPVVSKGDLGDVKCRRIASFFTKLHCKQIHPTHNECCQCNHSQKCQHKACHCSKWWQKSSCPQGVPPWTQDVETIKGYTSPLGGLAPNHSFIDG